MSGEQPTVDQEPVALPLWLCPPRPPELPGREVRMMTAGDALESAADRAFLADAAERKRLEIRRRQRVAREEKRRAQIEAGTKSATRREAAIKGAATKAARRQSERAAERARRRASRARAPADEGL